MDVHHQGHVHLLLDPVDGLGRPLIGDGETHDLAAGGTQFLDLLHGSFHVPGLGVAHGLDRDRGAAAQGQAAHADLSGILS